MDNKVAVLTGIILVIVAFAIIFNVADVEMKDLATSSFGGMKDTANRSLNTLP